MRKGIEGIKKELQQEIERYKAEIEAWEKVTVKTKKNGEEFQNIKKAITGGEINTRSYDDSQHPNLYVYFKVNHTYENDWIPVFHYLDELPDDDPRKAPYKKQFTRQTCIATAAEITERINARIKRRKEQIESLEKQLQTAEKTYAHVMELAQTIGKTIISLTDSTDGRKNSLAYAIAEDASDLVKWCR